MASPARQIHVSWNIIQTLKFRSLERKFLTSFIETTLPTCLESSLADIPEVCYPPNFSTKSALPWEVQLSRNDFGETLRTSAAHVGTSENVNGSYNVEEWNR